MQGLGASVELVRRIVADDVEALDLLDKALQGKVGRPAEILNNIKDNYPRGTSKDYALRKLRKDAPEEVARVMRGGEVPWGRRLSRGAMGLPPWSSR